MRELLELIMALLLALSQQGATPTAADERPQLEQRPMLVVTPADAPEGVDPAQQPGLVDPATGEITNADGSTDCVVASPCDFARAGYAPGQPHPDDIDPLWAELEEQ